MTKKLLLVSILVVMVLMVVFGSQPQSIDAGILPGKNPERPVRDSGDEGVTALISVFDNGQQFKPRGTSVISEDGRYVVLSTFEDYPEKGDENGKRDWYVYDRVTRNTSLASVSLTGSSPMEGAGGSTPAISADGRYVAYASSSPDIVENYSGTIGNVFVYDRDSEITEWVSSGPPDDREPNGNAGKLAMSSDGRYVAFESNASNLVENDNNGATDVFLRDRNATEPIRVSVKSGGGEIDSRRSYLLSISGNGRYVMFSTTAPEVVPGVTTPTIYIHDRDTRQTSVAAYDHAGDPIYQLGGWSYASIMPFMSNDGRYFVFETGSSTIVENDTNGEADIFISDREGGLPIRVSVTSGGAQADERSRGGTISADGRHVAFTSRAQLDPKDTDETDDIYVHHLDSGVTELVSLTSEGQNVAGNSRVPSLSGNGSAITFHSIEKLAPGIFDDLPAIFLRDRNGGKISLHTPLMDPIYDEDGDGTYLVQWTNVVNASEYELRETSLSGNQQQIYSGVERSYSVEGKGSGTWCYSVRSLGPNESSSVWSQDVCVEIPTCVPYFAQRDPVWANHPLRTDGRCSPSCNTIGACGCTLTAAAMLYSYYGSNLNPPQLSDAMGIEACPFDYWYGASVTQGKVSNTAYGGFSWERLDKELNANGRPVILGMYKGAKTHFVLATSGSGSDGKNYIVHDPAPEHGPDTNLGVYTETGWIPYRLVAYDGVPICSPKAGLVLQQGNTKTVGINSSGEHILLKNVHNTGESSAMVTGSVATYHINLDTVVVRPLAASSAGRVSKMKVWTDSTTSPEWQPLNTLAWIPWMGGDEQVYAQFRDELGNESEVYSDSMWPVTGPPDAPDSDAKVFNLLPLILGN